MLIFYPVLLVAFTLIKVVIARNVPKSTALTNLFQNNLNFTDDADHNSFLLVELNGQSKAEDACSQFMEKLVTVDEAKRDLIDLTKLIKYQIYSGFISSASHSIQLSDGAITLSHNTKSIQISKT